MWKSQKSLFLLCLFSIFCGCSSLPTIDIVSYGGTGHVQFDVAKNRVHVQVIERVVFGRHCTAVFFHFNNRLVLKKSTIECRGWEDGTKNTGN